MSSPSSFSVGLQWPLNSKRKVSTTEVGKSVWLAALIPISSDNAKILAAAIASEKNWRKNYIIHVHRFAELQAAASPVECLVSTVSRYNHTLKSTVHLIPSHTISY